MKVLHVGCGGEHVPFTNCTEIRMDMDPGTGADIIGNMLEIPMEDGSVDAVYTSHTLEHVTLHDGIRALREFRRVLADGGRAWVIVPNIASIAQRIIDGRMYEVVYEAAYKVCAADMLYGHQGLMEEFGGDKAYRFQHKFGYTPETLQKSFEAAGFIDVKTKQLNTFDVVCTGIK